MFNVITISDIHIGEYRFHNDNDFRLNQFLKLADTIVDCVKQNSVKEIWIAGDLLREAQSKPKVMYVVRQFLQKITLVPVRIVLGNHDVVVRNVETPIEDYEKCTLVSLLQDIKNFHIYYDDIIKINNKSVYFHSWVPKNNFGVKKADYLVCHGDTKKSFSPFSLNYIDTTGYKRVFAGHIHIFRELDNVISLGVPLQHNFGDDPNTGIVVYDLDSDTYKHIETNFLKFLYAKNEEEALKLKELSTVSESTESENKTENDNVEIRVKTDNSDVKIDISNANINPVELSDQFSQTLSPKAKEIVYNVTHSAYDVNDTVANLNFELQTISATNFLSIKSINFDFSHYDGLTVIRGLEGAGKSTLFNLIEFMFFGKLKNYSKSDYSSINKDGRKFNGTLTLKYKNSEYRIFRTLNSLEFYKNDKAIDTNRKKDLQSELETELDFLRFWDLIYIKQYSSGIFSEMTDTSRVSFLSSLIGLNVINKWSSEIQNYIDTEDENLTSKNNKLIEYNTKYNNLKTYINENQILYVDADLFKKQISCLSRDVKNIDIQVKKNSDLVNSYINANTELDNKIEKYNTLKDNIQKLSAFIKNEKEKLAKVKAELDKESPIEIQDLSEVNAKIKNIDNDILGINSKNAISKSNLKSLKEHPDTCPYCHQKWVIEGLDTKIRNLEAEVKNNDNEIFRLNSEKDKLISIINDVNKNIDFNHQLDEKHKKYDLALQDLKYKALELKSDIQEFKTYNITEINSKKADNNLKIDELKTKSADLVKEKLDKNNRLNSLNRLLGEVETKNNIFMKLQDTKDEVKKYKDVIDRLNSEIQSEKDLLSELSKFNSKVLSDTGLLTAALLKKVSDSLNIDNTLKVETVRTLQNGSLKPTLNIKLFVPQYNKYVDYSMLSGGQALMADLKFLKGITKMFGKISVMFLDEILKFFSAETVMDSIELLKEIDVDKIFLILHGDYETNTKVINVTLDKNKGSIYE